MNNDHVQKFPNYTNRHNGEGQGEPCDLINQRWTPESGVASSLVAWSTCWSDGSSRAQRLSPQATAHRQRQRRGKSYKGTVMEHIWCWPSRPALWINALVLNSQSNKFSNPCHQSKVPYPLWWIHFHFQLPTP